MKRFHPKKQEPALPHEKCYRKEPMPQIENVTQIILWTLNGGRPDGVNHESETGGNTGIPVPVSKGSEERKIVFAG
jgi:hypothetical protein